MTSFNLATSLKPLSTNTVTLGVRALLRTECWCPSNIHMLKSNLPTVMVMGGEVFGR